MNLVARLRQFSKGSLLTTSEKPTHVIDIYKNRRGEYKDVRVWCKIDLGTGERKDLFMTNADMTVTFTREDVLFLYKEEDPKIVNDWRLQIKK